MGSATLVITSNGQGCLPFGALIIAQHAKCQTGQIEFFKGKVHFLFKVAFITQCDLLTSPESGDLNFILIRKVGIAVPFRKSDGIEKTDTHLGEL